MEIVKADSRSIVSMLFLAPWIVVALPAAVAGQGEVKTEVQAAMIYQIANQVDWPQSKWAADGGFSICMIGQESVARVIGSTLRGRSIESKVIEVKRFEVVPFGDNDYLLQATEGFSRPTGEVGRSIVVGDEARGCHFFFVSSFRGKWLNEILDRLRQSSVLTIGEATDFIEAGGMIEFFLSAGKLRLELNPVAMREASINPRQRLLDLVKITGP